MIWVRDWWIGRKYKEEERRRIKKYKEENGKSPRCYTHRRLFYFTHQAVKVLPGGQFGVNMKAKKDGQETDLKLFDSDFIGMCYNDMQMVFSQITYLYVQSLHETGRMSDEEFNALMARAGLKPQGNAKSGG